MKKIAIILILLIFITNCTKNDKSKLLIGTWKIIGNKENYSEVKIDEKKVMILSSDEIDLRIENSRLENDYIFFENENFEPKIDSFKIICYSNDKIILRREFLNQLIEFNRIENNIKEIDSTDFKNWKEKTISDFKKRANSYFKSNNIKISETIDLGEVNPIEEIEIDLDSLKQ
ncbi:hypothetical protein HGB55_15255 [Lutibacter sp. B1]|nr:hypothetical protein [Lutibacter sp. B1]